MVWRQTRAAFWPTNPNFSNENNETTNQSYRFLTERPAGVAFLVPEVRSD